MSTLRLKSILDKKLPPDVVFVVVVVVIVVVVFVDGNFVVIEELQK